VPVAVAAQRGQRRPQPPVRLAVVGGADQRDDVAVGALEVAREQLHAEEAGGAGEQHGAVRHGERGAGGHGCRDSSGLEWGNAQAAGPAPSAQWREGYLHTR
jgi:hypothetical protein